MLGAGVSYFSRRSNILTVRLDNEITLDFIAAEREFALTHYAFLVSEKEFDEIFGRIRERRIPFWADTFHHRANEINTNGGGRGVYFEDLDGRLRSGSIRHGAIRRRHKN
jgi:hypothetical protein